MVCKTASAISCASAVDARTMTSSEVLTPGRFRPLTSSERADIREKRIRLVKAEAGETIEALAARSKSAWRKEEIAVANNLSVEDHLREGRLLKIAVAEPYEPKKPTLMKKQNFEKH